MQKHFKKALPHLMVGVAGMVIVGAAGSFGLDTPYQLLLAYILGAAGHAKAAPRLAQRLED